MKVDPYSGISTSFIVFTLKICILSNKKLEYHKKYESTWALNRTTYVFIMELVNTLTQQLFYMNVLVKTELLFITLMGI